MKHSFICQFLYFLLECSLVRGRAEESKLIWSLLIRDQFYSYGDKRLHLYYLLLNKSKDAFYLGKTIVIYCESWRQIVNTQRRD